MPYGLSTSNRPRCLAFSLLGGLYIALAPLPVAANQVSVTVNPTTGYAEVAPRTYSLPPNARSTVSSGVPSVERLPSGGARQSMPSGVEIVGVKDPSARGAAGVAGSLNATAGAMKRAALRCVTSFKCNVAAAAAAAGLDAVLAGVDWVMKPDGSIVQKEPIPADTSPGLYFWASGYSTSGVIPGSVTGPSPSSVCTQIVAFYPGATNVQLIKLSSTNYQCVYKPAPNVTAWTFVGRSGASCPAGSYYDDTYDGCIIGFNELPVSESDIESEFENNYEPDPTDWRFLLPGFDFSDPEVSIDVSPPSSPAAESLPSVTVYPDGSSSETTTSWDFSWTNNPGKQPNLEITETNTKNDYSPSGAPSGTTTTVSTSTPSAQPVPGPPDIPTDCDFMPTLCGFLEWFREPDPDSSDPYEDIKDLIQVYQDPGTTVAIGPYSAACPAPRIISLTFVPSVEVSFQPFCDLAATVRFWLLAIAYFGAAYVTVRSI